MMVINSDDEEEEDGILTGLMPPHLECEIDS